MVQTITGLSQREADFLSRLAAENRSVFRIEEVAEDWPDSATLHALLSRLQRGGWLRRIERGLYMLVPLSAGPGRMWAEDALVIGTRLVTPSAIAYWSALWFWNFTEQAPRTVFVQSPRRKFQSSLTIAGVLYQVVRIRRQGFFGVTRRMVNEQAIQVTDREKTILDATDRPDLSGGIGQLAQTLRDHWAEISWSKLDDYLAHFASGALYKRLGYLIEAQDLPIPDRSALLTYWQSRMTTGIALLDPSRSASEGDAAGVFHRRWRVRDTIGLTPSQAEFRDDPRS